MAYERRLPRGASGRDPVAESMRTVAPQDHATYAPVYGDNLAADIVDSQFGLAPPFEVEDRVVVMKPP
jgi:hypothetical protein